MLAGWARGGLLLTELGWQGLTGWLFLFLTLYMRLLPALGSVCCWQPEGQELSETGASLHPTIAPRPCIPAWAQVSKNILHPPSPVAGHGSWQRGWAGERAGALPWAVASWACWLCQGKASG